MSKPLASKNMRTHKAIVIGSAVVALLCTGTLLRWVRESRANEASVFTPLTIPLSELSTKIGTYDLARDMPLSANIVSAAAVDSFVQRQYVDPTTGKRMVVYVGYWGRENLGMGHGPEVCYPAVGWETWAAPTERTLKFRTPDQPAPVSAALHRFTRTEPEGVEKRAVGFLAVVSGDYRPTSQAVFWHLPGKLRSAGHYLAHVQVSCPVQHDMWNDAESDIVAFIEALLPHLSMHLPRIEDGEGHDDL
ncbi:MAG: exosortase-associated EpsI family protein [Phycisphaerales bacterium]|nr:MAG: exosortase-associated EpsI family protein [Phycisphaerales bacterium]